MKQTYPLPEETWNIISLFSSLFHLIGITTLYNGIE